MKLRLAVLATHPIQYHVPIWRILAQQPDLDVHVYYASGFSTSGYFDTNFRVTVKWDIPLTYGYSHTFLSKTAQVQDGRGFFGLRTNRLRQELQRFAPHVALLNAYTPFFWWESLWVLRSLRVSAILRAETTDVTKRRHPLKKMARDLFLYLFYRQIDQFLAIGQNSRNHYLAHGIPASRIGWSPYCVNTPFFAEQADMYLPQRSALRQEFGFLPDQTVFIYSGKLYDHKDPLIIPQAIEDMSEGERQKIGLVVLGDGVLRAEMEQRCRALLGDRAVFTGFVNQSQLGRYYALSDCLILPSLSETWGLVVNEAFQFGLPAVVSSGVGCAPDLVVESETGMIFPTGDARRLRHCLSRIQELLHLKRDEMNQKCRERVANYSLALASQGLQQAVFTFDQK